MNRGLKAPLSANEEITLRRVGYGIAKPNELIARDVEYLLRLALIHWQGERLVLTDVGQKRLAAMPGPHYQGGLRSNDQALGELMAALRKPQR